MRRAVIIVVLLLSACASTPQGRLRQGAELQKISVDGLGNTYLDICEKVERPRCETENQASKDTSSPWTRDDRIACLGPCASETASKISTGLKAVIASQLVVFGLLRSGDSDEKKLNDARTSMRDAAEELFMLLEDSGASDLVKDKLLGN